MSMRRNLGLDRVFLNCAVCHTSTVRTTPEATDLQAVLAGFLDAGITHVVMEVSSHALSLHRVDCINFDVAVFTNLGRDHLDFHGNPEAYFAAKARLFSADMCRQAIVNLDDVHGRLLSDTTDVPVSGFSVDQLASLQMDGAGSAFEWRGHSVALPLPGRHNVSNALAAATNSAVEPTLVVMSQLSFSVRTEKYVRPAVARCACANSRRAGAR